MIIDQLPAIATAGDNDEIAIEVGTTTYKIKKSNFLKEFMPKSGGEFTGDVIVDGALYVTNRRCDALLSSAGWYRVLKFEGTSSAVIGSAGMAIRLHITRQGTTRSAETHSITYRAANNGAGSFVEEQSLSGSFLIDKIRATYTNDRLYIDIHYSLSYENAVSVTFDVYDRTVRQSRYTAESLQAVANAPSGETVLTEYTFSGNGTGDLNVNGRVSGQGFFDLFFGVGEEIPQNSDCDSYTTVGSYTVATAAVAQTMTNTPFSVGFKMFVIRLSTAERYVQIAIPNSQNITIKIRQYNGSLWTEWKTLTPS